MKTPQYCLPLLFQILCNPLSPNSLSPPTSTPTVLSVVLFLLAKWVGDHATFDVLFYLMIIWNYTCQALVPWYQKDLDVCFMQQGVRFTEVWHNVIFYWYSNLILQTHKHTQHTQGPVDWHTHINICLHHLLCAHSSYLYYIRWLNKWLNE